MLIKFFKIIIILQLLSLSGCKNLSKTIYNPEPNIQDGTIIYDKKAGLKLKGGLAKGRHLEEAKRHCRLFNKKAKYESSGSTIKDNIIKTYEYYKCY